MGIGSDLVFVRWPKTTCFVVRGSIDLFFVWVVKVELFLRTAKNDLVFVSGHRNSLVFSVGIDLVFVCGSKGICFY